MIDFINQKENKNKYIKKVYKTFSFRVRKDTQQEIIKQVEKQTNKNSYLVNLIKKDINN